MSIEEAGNKYLPLPDHPNYHLVMQFGEQLNHSVYRHTRMVLQDIEHFGAPGIFHTKGEALRVLQKTLKCRFFELKELGYDAFSAVILYSLS